MSAERGCVGFSGPGALLACNSGDGRHRDGKRILLENHLLCHYFFIFSTACFDKIGAEFRRPRMLSPPQKRCRSVAEGELHHISHKVQVVALGFFLTSGRADTLKMWAAGVREAEM